MRSYALKMAKFSGALKSVQTFPGIMSLVLLALLYLMQSLSATVISAVVLEMVVTNTQKQ